MISAGQSPGKASPLCGTMPKISHEVPPHPVEVQRRYPRRLLELVTWRGVELPMGGQGGKGIHICCC